jgi:hypothetical protein
MLLRIGPQAGGKTPAMRDRMLRMIRVPLVFGVICAVACTAHASQGDQSAFLTFASCNGSAFRNAPAIGHTDRSQRVQCRSMM